MDEAEGFRETSKGRNPFKIKAKDVKVDYNFCKQYSAHCPECFDWVYYREGSQKPHFAHYKARNARGQICSLRTEGNTGTNTNNIDYNKEQSYIDTQNYFESLFIDYRYQTKIYDLKQRLNKIGQINKYIEWFRFNKDLIINKIGGIESFINVLSIPSNESILETIIAYSIQESFNYKLNKKINIKEAIIETIRNGVINNATETSRKQDKNVPSNDDIERRFIRKEARERYKENLRQKRIKIGLQIASKYLISEEEEKLGKDPSKQLDQKVYQEGWYILEVQSGKEEKVAENILDCIDSGTFPNEEELKQSKLIVTQQFPLYNIQEIRLLSLFYEGTSDTRKLLVYLTELPSYCFYELSEVLCAIPEVHSLAGDKFFHILEERKGSEKIKHAKYSVIPLKLEDIAYKISRDESIETPEFAISERVRKITKNTSSIVSDQLSFFSENVLLMEGSRYRLYYSPIQNEFIPIEIQNFIKGSNNKYFNPLGFVVWEDKKCPKTCNNLGFFIMQNKKGKVRISLRSIKEIVLQENINVEVKEQIDTLKRHIDSQLVSKERKSQLRKELECLKNNVPLEVLTLINSLGISHFGDVLKCKDPEGEFYWGKLFPHLKLNEFHYNTTLPVEVIE